MKRLPVARLDAVQRTGRVGRYADQPGTDALVLNVRGGELVAVVPSDAPARGAESTARVLRLTLRLEDERVLNIELDPSDGAVTVEDQSASLHRHGIATDAGHEGHLGWRQHGRTAGDVMTADVVTASADMLVEDVAKLLAFHGITGMPVEDWDGRVIGVVSEADVIGKIGDTVADVMSTDVISVAPTIGLDEVANVMTDRKIHRVLVMDGEQLRGVVSRADMVRALAV
ncbi:MAG: CBS domain-containing protein [Chloroflexota bacterium]